jgi:hypothetical protein
MDFATELTQSPEQQVPQKHHPVIGMGEARIPTAEYSFE